LLLAAAVVVIAVMAQPQMPVVVAEAVVLP
jgi:hypothetical protein